MVVLTSKGGGDMRLVNTKSKQPIVEFTEGEAIFHSKFLEHEMRSMGILIPHGLRGAYHGKDCIYLGEQEFQQAFKEVYYLTYMDATQFKWQE